jgi:hypothetical protein
MRNSIGIAVVALVALAGLWAWTLTQSGANAHKVRGAVTSGIDTFELTVKAAPMPTQQFDAH